MDACTHACEDTLQEKARREEEEARVANERAELLAANALLEDDLRQVPSLCTCARHLSLNLDLNPSLPGCPPIPQP